jgi:SAM-dependent methyltransferase
MTSAGCQAGAQAEEKSCRNGEDSCVSVDAGSDNYQAKVDFGDVYNQADPRSYYRAVGALDYEIPAHGARVFDRLLDELGGREGKTVLDVCCGYGANAALLNHDIELAELYEHYGSLENAADDAMAEIDRRWFTANRRPDTVSVIGLDVADNAVRYAISVGLLDQGVVANLEVGRPDEEAMRAFATADLISVTGGVGYVGEKTFRAIVEASGDDPPWVAALSLRWVDFSPIAEALDGLGLVTEQVEGYCVPQRRFANEPERQAAVAGLRARGLDSVPESLLGAHCAELYVSRPPEAVRAAPISDVLGFLAAESRRHIQR